MATGKCAVVPSDWQLETCSQHLRFWGESSPPKTPRAQPNPQPGTEPEQRHTQPGRRSAALLGQCQATSFPRLKASQAWWHMPVFPALWKLKQEDKLEPSLGFSAAVTQRPKI